MKILMAARRFPPDVWSGTETVFQNLYERARHHHEVRLVVGWRRDRRLVPAEAVAVNLQGRPKPQAWLAMARAVMRETRAWKPDVVLSNSIEVPPTGVPTVCIVHDLNFGSAHPTWVDRLKTRFYALRARALDAVITVSATSARHLRDVGIPERIIRVIHNGVDIEHFHPDPDARVRAGGDPPDMVHFAYPSRILAGKGQHHAIDAIARLDRAHKRRAHLTIVGAADDPVYLDQLRVQAYDQPVTFATDVPDMAPYYQRADVVLYPTVMEEGFGFTAVEAMACGKPVIWFDQPAIREATGGIGIPVPRGDVTALRDAVVALMDDPDERARLGALGRRYVENHLSWDRVWEKYERVLEAVGDR